MISRPNFTLRSKKIDFWKFTFWKTELQTTNYILPLPRILFFGVLHHDRHKRCPGSDHRHNARSAQWRTLTISRENEPENKPLTVRPKRSFPRERAQCHVFQLCPTCDLKIPRTNSLPPSCLNIRQAWSLRGLGYSVHSRLQTKKRTSSPENNIHTSVYLKAT